MAFSYSRSVLTAQYLPQSRLARVALNPQPLPPRILR
jgi:hypothetical protein